MDEYERRYLGAEGAIHREKRVSRRTFAILGTIAGGVGVLSGLSFVAAATGDPQGLGAGIGAGLLSVFLLVLGAATSVSRVVVGTRELRVPIGVRDRRIPLTAITSTSIGAISQARLRADVAADGAELAAVYGADRYVRVAWTDAEARARITWIGSDTPEVLRAAIEQARAGAAPSGVRVAADVEASEPSDAGHAAEPAEADTAELADERKV